MHRRGQGPHVALVAGARRGDQSAFGLLIQHYQKAICAIARGRLGDLEAAYDVAWEVFLVSFEGLHGLRSPSKFSPWLRRITRGSLTGGGARSVTVRR